jgi:hypothetical protein
VFEKMREKGFAMDNFTAVALVTACERAGRLEVNFP